MKANSSIFRLALLCTMALLIFTLSAFAGDGSAPEAPAFRAFFDQTLQPLLLSILGLAVTYAVSFLTGLLKRKFGIEISEATSARLRGIALDAVHAVEERAAATLKANGAKWESSLKHAAAVEYILGQVPALSQEEADNLVKASLAQIKGLGASTTGN